MSMNISPATHKEIVRRVTKCLERVSFWNISMTDEEIIEMVEEVLYEVKYLPKKKVSVIVGHNSFIEHPFRGDAIYHNIPIRENREIDEFYEHDIT